MVPDADGQSQTFLTTGRGNVTTSAKLSATTAGAADVTPALQDSKHPDVRYFGRGGAGNSRIWVSEVKEREELRSSHAKEEKFHRVVMDVEMGLRQPEKAHLGFGRDEFDT